jgi:hypothetical protein
VIGDRGEWMPTPAARGESPTTPAHGLPENPTEESRPWICVSGRQLRELSGDALAAIQAVNNPPRLFARMGVMAEIVDDEEHRALLRSVSVDSLRSQLSRAANFFKPMKEGAKLACLPPVDVPRNLLVLPPVEWGFPAIEAVTRIPILRSDGTVLSLPGYDAKTKLYYSPDANLRIPELADCPNADHVDSAMALLDEMLADFPWTDGASRANAIAALLTPITRSAISGPTPLALIDAPAAGTGKSLFVELISIITTGEAARMSACPREPDEWRKAITASLLDGCAVVVFDNVGRALDSPDLCRALTAETWADRELGSHRQLTLPVKCSWFATGNNVAIGGDMARRCYRIRLDAKTSRPYARGGFKVENLREWVACRRGELLAALLTLSRAWFLAGRPPGTVKPIGSFESWTAVTGGILGYAGVEGFLGNWSEMHAEIDEESQSLENFLLALREVFSSDPFTAGEIADLLRTGKTGMSDLLGEASKRQIISGALPGALAEAADRDGFFRRRLGKTFSRVVDRRFGESNVFVKRGALVHGSQQWSVASDLTGG